MLPWICSADISSADFNSFGYIPRKEIAGSYGTSKFNFLRNLHTIFHSGCTIAFPQIVYKGSNFSTFLSSLVLFFFFNTIAILRGMKQYFIVALVCISLIAEDVEHFVQCLFLIRISSLVKCLFTSFAHFLIRFFLTFQFSEFFRHSWYKSFVICMVRKYFLHLSFCALNGVFHRAKVFNFWSSSYWLFFFLDYAFDVTSSQA